MKKKQILLFCGIANISVLQEMESTYVPYNFKIVKKGDEDVLLPNVKYEIKQKVVKNGYTTIRSMTKVTDENGEINVKLLDGDKITLTAREIQTNSAYVLDSSVKQIVINRLNDNTPQVESASSGMTFDATNRQITLLMSNMLKTSPANHEKANITFHINKVSSDYARLRNVRLRLKETRKWKNLGFSNR